MRNNIFVVATLWLLALAVNFAIWGGVIYVIIRVLSKAGLW